VRVLPARSAAEMPDMLARLYPVWHDRDDNSARLRLGGGTSKMSINA
jgi:hypothetical protein